MSDKPTVIIRVDSMAYRFLMFLGYEIYTDIPMIVSVKADGAESIKQTKPMKEYKGI